VLRKSTARAARSWSSTGRRLIITGFYAPDASGFSTFGMVSLGGMFGRRHNGKEGLL
jgi:hypothetical protein